MKKVYMAICNDNLFDITDFISNILDDIINNIINKCNLTFIAKIKNILLFDNQIAYSILLLICFPHGITMRA